MNSSGQARLGRPRKGVLTPDMLPSHQQELSEDIIATLESIDKSGASPADKLGILVARATLSGFAQFANEKQSEIYTDHVPEACDLQEALGRHAHLLLEMVDPDEETLNSVTLDALGTTAAMLDDEAILNAADRFAVSHPDFDHDIRLQAIHHAAQQNRTYPAALAELRKKRANDEILRAGGVDLVATDPPDSAYDWMYAKKPADSEQPDIPSEEPQQITETSTTQKIKGIIKNRKRLL